jgi:hypothetical protein
MDPNPVTDPADSAAAGKRTREISLQRKSRVTH